MYLGGDLPPGLEDEVLRDDHPVEVGQGEVGLDVEHRVLADGDLAVGRTDVDMPNSKYKRFF